VRTSLDACILPILRRGRKIIKLASNAHGEWHTAFRLNVTSLYEPNRGSFDNDGGSQYQTDSHHHFERDDIQVATPGIVGFR
jgi:hypothetical protein